MAKVKEIMERLERMAPLYYQESYDNCGLQVGDPDATIKGILLCIDVTEDVLCEAVQKKCNLVISHHPLLFKGIKRIDNSNYIGRCVLFAIKNDIAVYACHTNIDKAIGGVSFKMAEKLALKNVDVLEPEYSKIYKLVTFVPQDYAEKVANAMFEAGAGASGSYDKCSFRSEGIGTYRAKEQSHPFCGEIGEYHHEKEARIEVLLKPGREEQIVNALKATHPYESPAYDIIETQFWYDMHGIGCIGELEEAEDSFAFLQKVKKIFDVGCVRYTHCRSITRVKKVALCGGAGYDCLQTAIKRKADIYISADFKYHNFFDGDSKIIIADIGHFESEQFTKEIFYNAIIEKNDNFAIHYSEVNTNPIKYL